MAARGGLEGGDGSPVEGTSGIPLGPGDARSAVVETLQARGRRVDDIGAGEDIGLAEGNVLAVTTTITVIIIVFHWRHCCWRMPRRLSDYLNFLRGFVGHEGFGSGSDLVLKRLEAAD